MYKLLIIDDEIWTRKSLKSYIDWGEKGISVICEACNGVEGIEVFERESPEIIITDIRMPVMDGLEFIKKLKEKEENTKVIIISGYSDFNYAKEAIKFGAFDYILKPIEECVLNDVVTRCIEKIKSEKEANAIVELAHRQVKENDALLKEKFYKKLLNGCFNIEMDVKKEMIDLGIVKECKNYICLIIHVDNSEMQSIEKDWNLQLFGFALCNIIENFLDKMDEYEVLFQYYGDVECIVFSNDSEDIIKEKVFSIANAIKKSIKRVLRCTTTIALGEIYQSYIDICLSYNEAKRALKHREYFGEDKIYDSRNIDVVNIKAWYKVYDSEKLVNNIKIQNRGGALNSLDNIIELIKKEGENITPIELRYIYFDIYNSIFKGVIEGNPAIDNFFDTVILEKLQNLQSIDEMKKWLVDSVLKIIDYLEDSNNSINKTVKKSVEYITKHYMEAISLNYVAEKMYMNASYFCTIFKNEMGDTFTQYLIKYRIKKAIEFMDDPSKKIYEIAKMVGYDDVHYFSKTFKAYKGVSPAKYRDKIRIDK